MYSEKLSIIKQSLGSYYESNDEMLFHCPKCKHHKKKLSVNINKNAFKCWICDYRGNNLGSLIRDRELRSRWNSLVNQIDITRFDDLFKNKDRYVMEKSLDLPEHFTPLSSRKLSAIGLKAKKYLLDRGVLFSDILLYKMGFCYHGPYSGRVIVPSFDHQGELNYYIARSFDDSYLKYKNPPCSKDIIFNDVFIDWDKPVVLVEGFFDSLKYENSVPILGSTLNMKTKLFMKIVENCKMVYICLDQDAKQKELKIVKNLLDFGVKVCKIELYDYSDLGDVPDHLLSEYKKRASLITREDYLLQKLDFGG